MKQDNKIIEEEERKKKIRLMEMVVVLHINNIITHNQQNKFLKRIEKLKGET